MTEKLEYKIEIRISLRKLKILEVIMKIVELNQEEMIKIDGGMYDNKKKRKIKFNPIRIIERLFGRSRVRARKKTSMPDVNGGSW